MKYMICLLAVLCQLVGNAQRGCTIGDTILPMEWKQVMHTGTNTIHTNQFRGKWLLIDFWASWCSSCTKSFGRLDSLQEQFGNRIHILMVNPKESGDDAAKLEKFFTKRQSLTGKPFTLPVVWGDTMAFQNFPFKLLPHCIWVDPNGVVQGITGKQWITAETINCLLNGQIPNWPVKVDWKDE